MDELDRCDSTRLIRGRRLTCDLNLYHSGNWHEAEPPWERGKRKLVKWVGMPSGSTPTRSKNVNAT